MLRPGLGATVGASMPAPTIEPPPAAPAFDEARFTPSRATLLLDRFMTRFIAVGGLGVIVAVFGIFVFILSQILPLFRGAQVTELKALDLPQRSFVALLLDEGAKSPALLDREGRITFLPADGQPAVESEALTQALGGASLTAFRAKPRQNAFLAGTSDGRFAFATLSGRETKVSPVQSLGAGGSAITQLDFGDAGDAKLIAALTAGAKGPELHAVRLTRKRTLMGTGADVIDGTFDLTPLLKGTPEHLLVSALADSILVGTREGEVQYLVRSGDGFEVRQTLKPFGDLPGARLSSLGYVFGDVSFVATSERGENRVFSLHIPKGSEIRLFAQTKRFPALPGPASFTLGSLRNKAFLTASGATVSLRYATTEGIRWEQKLPFEPRLAAINSKYSRLAFAGSDGRLHLYTLDDPHPDTGFRSLFGKVWYEGYAAPSYEWQSTGGSDEFEPKYSMIPLIVGTLKGTFYAMLFAVPIALLAAIYTSQFLHPNFRALIKPTMEIMASLPSVVLGFLAALWLAPLIETRVPSVLLCAVLVPASAAAFGWFWAGLPIRTRLLVKPGYEFIVFFPILFLVTWVGWNLGPLLERLVFTTPDPATGTAVADFRRWWPAFTGASFEQRNSLVVGFVMGFAVIPILFTIAEDSLSNVPPALRAGSLALGASRWQTALRVVVPTASPGIFSALMVGLGRAVGETMIVVMATGNTSVLDLNIFSGMRTLSANIAVELPEAPHHSTLYRTLFLGAMLLFLLTFVVNTAAEVIRQRLRDRYKTI
ncbi:MAG: ABC transporter permease subunit [Verrucomicrobia bacterium]|nr:ABC transporter permease subunit [Verrucomicrobiota bacterium]